jgi:hypothetical protein
MQYKELRAGRKVRLFCISSMIVWILFTIVMGIIRGLKPFLLLPVSLALINFFWFCKTGRKPIFLLSENELILRKARKRVALEKIIDVIQIGKDRIDLIFKDKKPLQLYVHELSLEDREILKSSIEDIIKKPN